MISLRAPTPQDCPAASDLCFRSKAYWGYDDTFMQACRDELRLTQTDIANDDVVLAVDDETILGVAQVSGTPQACYLEKLFVDPDHMGQGVGRRLFSWSVAAAEARQAQEMIVEADPGAVPFYHAMGCIPAGRAPSGSVAGRYLPRLIYRLG